MVSRSFIPLAAVAALFAACSKPPAEAPLAEVKPTPTATASPAPAVVADFSGTWALTDEQGQGFEILVFPNGQAVSTWTKGANGARGERGFWRIEGGRLVAVFSDGWSDVISPRDGGFFHQGFEAGTPLDGTPKNSCVARRLDAEGSVGVWRLNKEPDGSYLYVTLQASGRAVSTIGGGTEGIWSKTDEGTLCKWPDGWNDLIYSGAGGYQKRSWVGPAEQNTTPPDISPALRVGESKFSITP